MQIGALRFDDIHNVTSIPTSPATYIGSSRGILINKSDQSFVACNTVSNVERGIMWENLSASSKMLGNDMTNCYDHLYLRNNPGLGYQYATISVSGVKTDVPSDNTWQWPILNSHTNSEVSNFPIGTTFEVRSNFSPYVGAVNSLIGGTPFDIVYFSPESYSGADFCASLSANKVDFDQEQLIAENIVYDYIESENENWQSKLYLYRELLKDTALLNSDTIMMNQKDSLESTNLAALDLVATSLFSIITDTVLSDEQKDSALIELAVINSEIEAGILVEDLEQQMNNFIIEKMSRDSIGISEEDRDFLESIALNCTQKGGNAVFVAWSLLTLLDSTNNSYNDSCSQEESRIRDTDENVNKHVEIMIQPNPADNFILISIIGESVNHNFDFEIKNIDGKLVERNSSVNAQQITLNTAKYASGIYTLKVSIEGRTLTSKFIITH